MLVVFVVVAVFRIRQNETNSSLSSYIHYDFLQNNLKRLEDENLKLRAAVGLHTNRVGVDYQLELYTMGTM